MEDNASVTGIPAPKSIESCSMKYSFSLPNPKLPNKDFFDLIILLKRYEYYELHPNDTNSWHSCVNLCHSHRSISLVVALPAQVLRWS